MGSVPGWGRSTGEGNGNPLQYSCLENPVDKGAWQATVHVVTKVGDNLTSKPPPSHTLSKVKFSSVQLFSCVQLFANPRIAAHQASLSITTPRVHPKSCPSSQRCHQAISFSVDYFSSCCQSLPASESFPMSQLFSRGGQSIGVSASASVLPMNTQD